MAGSQTVRTSPEQTDRRLAGRTYAIPFEDVWQGALRIIEARKRWTLDSADDEEGIIVASVRALHQRFNSSIRIRIGLDGDGQTRADAVTDMPRAFADMGMNARRVDGFFRALDTEAQQAHESRTAARRNGGKTAGTR